MDNMLNIKINNIPCTVPYGTTILEAARSIGIEVPTLCFLKDMNEIGACRCGRACIFRRIRPP